MEAVGRRVKPGVHGYGALPESIAQRIAALPQFHELNIGHALIADALELGYTATIKAYLACLGQ